MGAPYAASGGDIEAPGEIMPVTNAIESINARLRKIIKTRGHFPSDDAATKLIWLALRNAMGNRTRTAHEWRSAMNELAIAYGDRFTSNRPY